MSIVSVTTPLSATGSPERVGHKAATLARLAAAGMPVPPGIAIEAGTLSPVVGGAAPDSATASGGLRAAVDRGYRNLVAVTGRDAVAVRSSGLGEDSAVASHAGQHDTFLNVAGLDDVIAAIARCCASSSTRRARAYRLRHGVEAGAMAVLVQQFIDADASGVILTRDPVAARDVYVVTATWGLGDALVSGRVSPDTVVVDRNGARIQSYAIGDKAVTSVPRAAGTHLVGTAPHLRRRPVLEEVMVRRLSSLAEAITAVLGAAQEIEWAIAGDTAYVLQARPMTGVGSVPERISGGSPAESRSRVPP